MQAGQTSYDKVNSGQQDSLSQSRTNALHILKCYAKEQRIARNSVVDLPHLEVVAIERKGPTDKCIEDHPKTPHIHLWAIVLLPLEQLGSCVGRAPAERIQFVAGSELIAEPKVSNLDVHVGI